MSFGVGGYGLADMELLLHEEVVRFGVDYVVIALFNGNDLRDTWLGVPRGSPSLSTFLASHIRVTRQGMGNS